MSRLTRWFAASRSVARQRSCRLGLAAAIVVMTLPGCMSLRGVGGFAARDPMANAPKLRNFENPSKEELVSYLNKNTEKLESWKSNSIKIYTSGIMLSGTLAVERDRRVRLQVNTPLGKVVDLGSNDDRIWLWSKQMEPEFVTCKHENLDSARQALGIPFEPAWLMEALGIAPIPSTGVTMELDPGHTQARLVQHITSAHGQPLRRAMVVDLRKGRCVVVEHSLYDNFAQPLAIAKLSGHRPDKDSGVVMPHRVSLDWPQQRMQITMEFGKVQINPASISQGMWEMPQMSNCEVVHLDAHFNGERPAAFVKLENIEDEEGESLSDENVVAEEGFDRPVANTVGHTRISQLDAEDESDEEEFEQPVQRQYVAPAEDDWSE